MTEKSFTITSKGGVFREILTNAGVSEFVHDIKNKNNIKIHETIALWDTGATNSVITPKTVSELNIKPIGVRQVYHAGGVSNANVYLVNIYLPNNVNFLAVQVTECAESSGSFGIIIGMDIITKGDFAITNVNGNTVVSVRYPSVQVIDFVEGHKKLNEMKNSNKRVGRNEQCPCGSGKKYKNCHGR